MYVNKVNVTVLVLQFLQILTLDVLVFLCRYW